MENIVIIAILLFVVGFAGCYVYKTKKNGKKCIGCPVGCSCDSDKCYSCNSSCRE